MKITYRELKLITPYKAIETIHTVKVINYWKVKDTSLVYAYKDRFNIITIAESDIIKIEESEI